MGDLTQRQLEELVVGKNPNPNAIFFEHAVLNVPKSKEEGRRCYEKKTYIKLSQTGVTDTISYQAQKADLAQYPDEYQYFLSNKQGVRKPGIDIIPNLDIAHLQELRDYGILTIPQLAEMNVVPPHLEYAHRAAKIFNKALQESSNGSIEEDIEEEGSSKETEDVLASDRQAHRPNVGRSTVPSSNGKEKVTGNARRNDTGGQEHLRESVNWGNIDNWSMKINV